MFSSPLIQHVWSFFIGTHVIMITLFRCDPVLVHVPVLKIVFKMVALELTCKHLKFPHCPFHEIHFESIHRGQNFLTLFLSILFLRFLLNACQYRQLWNDTYVLICKSLTISCPCRSNAIDSAQISLRLGFISGAFLST